MGGANARENAELNNCPQIEVFQGTIEDVYPNSHFDIILANINRNVLLAEIPTYTNALNENGYLVVSGFYEHDASDIGQKATEAGLSFVRSMTNREWTSLVFQK